MGSTNFSRRFYEKDWALLFLVREMTTFGASTSRLRHRHATCSPAAKYLTFEFVNFRILYYAYGSALKALNINIIYLKY